MVVVALGVELEATVEVLAPKTSGVVLAITGVLVATAVVDVAAVVVDVADPSTKPPPPCPELACSELVEPVEAAPLPVLELLGFGNDCRMLTQLFPDAATTA